MSIALQKKRELARMQVEARKERIRLGFIDEATEQKNNLQNQLDNCTVQVRGIGGGVCDSEKQLRKAFAKYGKFVQSTIKKNNDDPELTWALVTMSEERAVERILSSAVRVKGKVPGIKVTLDITRYDKEMAKHDMNGELSQLSKEAEINLAMGADSDDDSPRAETSSSSSSDDEADDAASPTSPNMEGEPAKRGSRKTLGETSSREAEYMPMDEDQAHNREPRKLSAAEQDDLVDMLEGLDDVVDEAQVPEPGGSKPESVSAWDVPAPPKPRAAIAAVDVSDLPWQQQPSVDQQRQQEQSRDSSLLDDASFEAKSTAQAFRRIDTDGSGAIDYSEFVSLAQQEGWVYELSEAELRLAWSKIDADQSGSTCLMCCVPVCALLMCRAHTLLHVCIDHR